MITCSQVCMYNFRDDGCLKPADKTCPLSNVAYKEQKPITNADRIRAMSDEELAVLVRRGVCELIPASGAHCEYTTCADCVLNWLQQPCEGGADRECS